MTPGFAVQSKVVSTTKPNPTPKPVGVLQRKCACGGSPGHSGECEDCKKKKAEIQTKAAGKSGLNEFPEIVSDVLRSPGQPLDAATRGFFESRFGHDFSQVRIHTDTRAAASARSVDALAYTAGSHIVFGTGGAVSEAPRSRQLLAHELAHVVQQRNSGTVTSNLGISAPEGTLERDADRAVARLAGPGRADVHESSPFQIQRRVSYNVLDWDAAKLGPPTPVNGTDPRYITIPPSGQILISSLVEVDGGPGDNCAGHELGTTQAAWMAWAIAYYRGQKPTDGRVTARLKVKMPMRDPGPGGSIWYDDSIVRSPSACGDSAGIFHRDSPWHSIPKAHNNSKVAGSPLNYLIGYTRGLHLVTYLTAREPGGAFLPQPLRFRYWNSIQDFNFTPNYASPMSMWAYTGQVKVNIGSKGTGVVADAPYWTTAGPTLNDYFNDSGNWVNDEQA
jgi:hypothetical protein